MSFRGRQRIFTSPATYLKTDCSETFDASNNSLACPTLRFGQPGQSALDLSTDGGAVLEMTGE
jgi:hypothetical protein